MYIFGRRAQISERTHPILFEVSEEVESVTGKTKPGLPVTWILLVSPIQITNPRLFHSVKALQYWSGFIGSNSWGVRDSERLDSGERLGAWLHSFW